MEDNNEPILNNLSTQIEQMNYSFTTGRIPQLNPTCQDTQILMLKEETKNLKQTIKAYQKTIEEQNQKLSSHDNLTVEYKSLHQNYATLEYALSQCKIECATLREKLACKDQMISDFQKVIEISKSKFQMYDETNMALKLKIEEYETKLKLLPTLTSKNEELNLKLKEIEAKHLNLKNETEKKEELFKVKITGIERTNKLSSRQFEEDISDLKIANEKLKVENEKLKKEAKTANDDLKEKEAQHKKKLFDKEKENERLSKNIHNMQIEIKESKTTSEEKSSKDAEVIRNLMEKLEKLEQKLNEKDEETEQLNAELIKYGNLLENSQKEIEQNGIQITHLQEEKDKLLRQLNDKQIDFVEYQNSSQKEVDILHTKLVLLEKEKNELFIKFNEQGEEVKILKEAIGNYEQNNKDKSIQYKTFDKKYEELLEALKIKDEEYNSEYQKYGEIIKKSQNDLDILKVKYEKKIQMQKLKINELNTRISNLINYFVGLKDYALSIERSINDNNNGMVNNSMYLTSPFSLNLDGQNDNQAYSKRLLNGMKEMISKMDSKIFSYNPLNSSSISYNNLDI